jgi:hypothetical protein
VISEHKEQGVKNIGKLQVGQWFRIPGSISVISEHKEQGYIQGGSDKSGTISMLHRRVK